ncbi:hypothetical protein P5V15_009645 [Pogonomyrmex californicus]
MSCEKPDFAKNRCPVTCPKVREQLRKAIKECPNITDGIFPRKKNNEVLRLPVDVISKNTRDIPEQIVTKEFPVNSIEKIADRIDEEIDLNGKRIDREPAIIREEIDIPSEKIPDIDYVEEKIDLNEKKLDQEVVIIEKEIDIPPEKIPDIDYVEEKIDLNEKKLDQEIVIIEKEIDIPSEKIPDIDYVEEKIDLNEKKLDQEVVIIKKEIDIPPEKIPDIDYVEEKIDLNEKKLDQEVVIIEKEIDIPPEKIPDIDYVEEKIDLNEKKLDQEVVIIKKEIDIPPEKIPDIDYVEEKIDLNEKKLDQEIVIIEKEIDIPPEKIPDIDYVEEKIDLNEKKLDQEIVIIEKEIDIPPEKIPDIDYVEEKIDLNEKKLDQEIVIIEKEIDIPPEKIPDIDYVEEKIDLNEKKLDQEVVIIEKEIDIPSEKIPDIDYVEEKIDLNEEKLKREDEEYMIIQEEAVPIKRITDEKIDFVEKEDSVVERVTVEPAEEVLVAIEKQEIIEDEIERAPAAPIDLETLQELEKDFELKELEEYVEEEEEGITDYEKFIDEELRELLPAVIAREIPEEPREVERREISRNAVALYNGIDRERPVRAPREPEAVTAMPEERPVREEIPARALEDSMVIDRIVSREPAPVTADVCDKTCCLIWKQRERIIRKLKERQRIIDHYYLTKGFSYFEDVCTCSLACMVYTLSRDPFVRSIFASLALFAVGLKLCSELDAWEMPSRVS